MKIVEVGRLYESCVRTSPKKTRGWTETSVSKSMTFTGKYDLEIVPLWQHKLLYEGSWARYQAAAGFYPTRLRRLFR